MSVLRLTGPPLVQINMVGKRRVKVARIWVSLSLALAATPALACFDGSEYGRSFAKADPFALLAIAMLVFSVVLRLSRTKSNAYVPVIAGLLIIGPLIHAWTAYSGDCGFSYIDTATNCAILSGGYFVYELVRFCIERLRNAA